MGRLTEESNWCFLSCSVGTSVREDCPMYANCMTRLMYDKLKHYEDLEEQGRLIERKQGHWIHEKDDDEGNDNAYYSCSVCGAGDIHSKSVSVPYCWKCGASMTAKLKELEGVKE